MKQLILIPIWGREEVVRQTLAHHDREGRDLLLILSRGDPTVGSLRLTTRFTHVFANNDCLSAKYQRGLDAALQIPGWDELVLCGSDDFISSDYLSRPLVRGFDYMRLRDTWYYCRRRGCVVHGIATMPGAGTRITRKTIEQEAEGVLWPVDKNTGCDGMMFSRLIRTHSRGYTVRELWPGILDVKDEDSTWRVVEADRGYRLVSNDQELVIGKSYVYPLGILSVMFPRVPWMQLGAPDMAARVS